MTEVSRRALLTGVGVAGAAGVGVGLGAGAITWRDGRPNQDRTVTSSVRAEFGQLPPEDAADLANADRGFIGTLESPKITAPDGHTVYDTSDYDFLSQDVPDTAHPSLWRQSRLAAKHGLYEVAPTIYQVRGVDLANMTLIEGATGVIVIDTMTSIETAAAALELYRKHRGNKPVVGVIYTHPHVDHFGGAAAVVPTDRPIPILAPTGFIEHAVSENVFAGPAMKRRASFMYGSALERGPADQIGCGLGTAVVAGATSLIPPNDLLTTTGDIRVIDGVTFQFQMTPGTEAPAEMNIYLPDLNALCVAENATHTMHNIITLRGAQVRDAHQWAAYLTEAIGLFGHADVVFGGHLWPIWGSTEVNALLSAQRDLYAYMHDQTVRLMNQGRTGAEIADELELPPALANVWANRGYYGSLSHNVKGIYQRYMGWFDGNPAHLDEHPPVEQAKRWVAVAGGIEQASAAARRYAREGDLRFAATLLNHCVFAEPDNQNVKDDLAGVYEQLGHRNENAVWRNFYLTGAKELREGIPPSTTPTASALAALSVEQLIDSIAIRIDGPKAWDLDLAIDWDLTDLEQLHHLRLRNGVLTHTTGVPAGDAALTLTMTKSQLVALLSKKDISGISMRGNGAELKSLLSVVQEPAVGFPIVTP